MTHEVTIPGPAPSTVSGYGGYGRKMFPNWTSGACSALHATVASVLSSATQCRIACMCPADPGTRGPPPTPPVSSYAIAGSRAPNGKTTCTLSFSVVACFTSRTDTSSRRMPRRRRKDVSINSKPSARVRIAMRSSTGFETRSPTTPSLGVWRAATSAPDPWASASVTGVPLVTRLVACNGPP